MEAPNQPSAAEKLQDKADILENNLFSALSKQNNPIHIQFQINREQFPNPVIIKALLQLLPRINIKGPKIIITLNQLLNRPIPKDSQLKTEKQLLDVSGTDNPDLSRLTLTLKILLTSKLLTLSVKGTPVIPSRDGAIAKAFFDHKSCPGALSKDGIMDYREINKYPIAKAGDNLFFIIPESQGKPGMGYDGQIIQVPNALALKINLNGGVEKVDSLDTEGKELGYFLKAVKTGVVVLSRDGNKITDIGISDELEINRLDYSTGNIGTSFICPISMKIDTICNGFKIRARGMVEANVLEGGEIETDSQAHLHTIQPGSRVTAQKDIIAHFARNAVLTSETGSITLLEEVMDSTLCSVEIRFEKNKGVMTSNTLDAETIFLKNIYFCGENTIHFGRRLFSRKQALINALQTLETETSTLNEQEKEWMERFHHELQRLTKT
ncbi:MAG: FapA family protein, partial [Proteobacteria bacterium]|nr:FapA family protein [Pseudomonadota bacterium]